MNTNRIILKSICLLLLSFYGSNSIFAQIQAPSIEKAETVSCGIKDDNGKYVSLKCGESITLSNGGQKMNCTCNCGVGGGVKCVPISSTTNETNPSQTVPNEMKQLNSLIDLMSPTNTDSKTSAEIEAEKKLLAEKRAIEEKLLKEKRTQLKNELKPIDAIKKDDPKEVNIIIIRNERKSRCTIGKMFVNGEEFSYTLELPFNLNEKGESSIPVGTYPASVLWKDKKSRWVIELKTISKQGYYSEDSKLTMINRENIQIHFGDYQIWKTDNNEYQLEGCIVPGPKEALSDCGFTNSSNINPTPSKSTFENLLKKYFKAGENFNAKNYNSMENDSIGKIKVNVSIQMSSEFKVDESVEKKVVISNCAGDIQAKIGGKWRKIKCNENDYFITEKDSIKTDGESAFTLKWRDGHIVKIYPKTELTYLIDGLSIRIGKILTSIDKNTVNNSSRFNVITPTCIAELRGTKFITNVSENGATEIKLFEGEVEIETTGSHEKIILTPGKKVRITADGKIDTIENIDINGFIEDFEK